MPIEGLSILGRALHTQTIHAWVGLRDETVGRLRFAIALPGLLMATSALGGVPSWTLSEASGPVTVASSGMVRVGNRGATLSAGDAVATGAKGRAVIVRGQEYLVIAPNSRLRVADPAKHGGVTQIVEQLGNVVYRIRKMATPHFAVETPFLAAVVKGTTFSVTVTESGASVQVIEGRVEVETRDGGARYLVLPGDIGSVSAKALGRLNIQGRENRTIVSPNEGRGPAVPTAPTAQLLQGDETAVAAAQPPADARITVAVSEPPVRLGAATDGMVSGALIAMVTAAPQRSAVVTAVPVPDVAVALVGTPSGNSGSSATAGAPTDAASSSGNGGPAPTPPAAPPPAPTPPVDPTPAPGNGNGNGGPAPTPPVEPTPAPGYGNGIQHPPQDPA